MKKHLPTVIERRLTKSSKNKKKSRLCMHIPKRHKQMKFYVKVKI